jgi:hypothetical protein
MRNALRQELKNATTDINASARGPTIAFFAAAPGRQVNVYNFRLKLQSTKTL